MGEVLSKSNLGIKLQRNCFIHVKKYADPHMRPHGHSFLEIVYILRGHGQHEIGQECFPVSPGDIFIISTEAVHRFISDSEEDPILHYDCLLFLDEAADQVDYGRFREIAGDLFYNVLFPQDVNRAPYIRLRDTTSQIERVLKIMEAESVSETPDSRNMLFGCAIELLVWISRLYKEQFGGVEIVRARRQGILDAMNYLEKNYAQRVSLNELSRIALFSPNYFCTLFRETTGCSVTEYIQRIRNKEAVKLLLTTDLTVREICYAIGYNDEKFFRNVFFREMGYTPGKYRQLFKK